MGIWAGERATSSIGSGRREIERLHGVTHGADRRRSVWSHRATIQEKLVHEQRICPSRGVFRPSGIDKMPGIEGWRLGGHDHEVSILIAGGSGLA